MFSHRGWKSTGQRTAKCMLLKFGEREFSKEIKLLKLLSPNPVPPHTRQVSSLYAFVPLQILEYSSV